MIKAGASDRVVDLAFDLAGSALPTDHAFALKRAVVDRMPWLESEPDAGLHPLRAAPTDYGVVLLPRRAKLVLRLPEQRVSHALALAGHTLAIGSESVRLTGGEVRELRPYGAMYAHFVVAPGDSEEDFLADLAALLATRALPCHPVCGKRQTLAAEGRRVVGFSLMLHELEPEHSLALQRVGIGGERLLGCGIFLPHRLAAAVRS